MNIDFPLVLVVLTLATGGIWLLDVLLLRRFRPAVPTGESTSAPAATPAEPPAGPWLVEASRSFFPVLAFVLVLRSFVVEPFQIPSGSMLPTLEVGDFILVNKFSYGLRLPVLGTKVVELDDPQRGEVVVFRYPVDGKTNYIKRVVGVPGDRIRYRNKQIFVNGEPVRRDFLVSRPPADLYNEYLGDHKHLMQLSGRYDPAEEGEWVVPEGHYFMVGDNRDYSNDSRYWGMVPDEMIVGKAFGIWMHWKSIKSLPSFSRVGSID